MSDENELRLRIARLEGRQRMAIGMGAVGLVMGTLSLAWARPWSATDDLTLHHLRVVGPEGTVEILPSQMIETSRSGSEATIGVSDIGADLELGGGGRGFEVQTKPGAAALFLGNGDGGNVSLRTTGGGTGASVDADFTVYGSATTSLAVEPGAPHISMSNATYHVDLAAGESLLKANGNGHAAQIDLK